MKKYLAKLTQMYSNKRQEADMEKMHLDGQITFLYYPDLKAAAAFYGDLMGFELVDDQRWAKIYRVSASGYVGIVAGEKGFCRPQERNAVLVTLLTREVDAWYEKLKERGVKLLSGIQEKKDIGVRCFFLEDPGGYALEIQQFLLPRQAGIFHGGD
jgi:predicted enzyme related to lactoylglutathione lyase